MDNILEYLKQVSNELQLVRAETALLKDTVVNTNQQMAEVHALIEDVAQKIDIIDARPLTNPTPKPRASKRTAVAQTPVIDMTTANIPPTEAPPADVAAPIPPMNTPLTTPRPADTANIKMPQPTKKKYDRNTYFKELYNQDPHKFDESMLDILETLPTTEPERRSAVYKILCDDQEMREWLINQAREMSK